MEPLGATLRLCHLSRDFGPGVTEFTCIAGDKAEVLTDQGAQGVCMMGTNGVVEGTEDLGVSPVHTKKALSFCLVIKIKHAPYETLNKEPGP